MPLLEFGEDKPLSHKFSFLNLSQQEDNRKEDKITKQGSQERPRASFVTQVSKHLTDEEEEQVISVDDMQPVGVIKTTGGTSKLFVNLATPAKSSSKPICRDSLFLFSALSNDMDKSGVSCLVITALDLTSRINLDLSSDVLLLLDHVRRATQLSVGNKYTLPRMRKKGKLTQVFFRPSTAPALQTSQGEPQSTAKVSNITELEPATDDNVYQSSGSKKSPGTMKHSTTKLTVAAQALPLPTRYSHHFFTSLPISDRPASWSVYFDGQDSTIKVLIPPAEEFITLQAVLDDFRAFSKDDKLHIFFIGTT